MNLAPRLRSEGPPLPSFVSSPVGPECQQQTLYYRGRRNASQIIVLAVDEKRRMQPHMTLVTSISATEDDTFTSVLDLCSGVQETLFGNRRNRIRSNSRRVRAGRALE
jgi:hypothetical protein